MASEKKAPKEFEGYKFKGTGLTTAEKHWAKSQFDEYREHYHLEHLSDLKLLEELVYREAFQERYKKKIEKLVKKLKEKSKKTEEILSEDEIVPKYVLDALNRNLEQILILKEKLGLFEEKKGEDPYKYHRRLMKKFKIWMEENQGSRTLSCPHCSKMIMLKIRIEVWEALKHPFFKDRILANKHLWKLYKEGKITKLDMAKILLGEQTESIDYIDWLEEKIYLKDSK